MQFACFVSQLSCESSRRTELTSSTLNLSLVIWGPHVSSLSRCYVNTNCLDLLWIADRYRIAQHSCCETSLLRGRLKLFCRPFSFRRLLESRDLRIHTTSGNNDCRISGPCLPCTATEKVGNIRLVRWSCEFEVCLETGTRCQGRQIRIGRMILHD